jgi:hypothetical protein
MWRGAGITAVWLAFQIPGAPPSMREAEEGFARLAAELVSTELPPIPLDADGSGRHGVMYDRIRLGQLIAKHSPPAPPTGSGTPFTPLPSGVVIVAYPLSCEAGPNLPRAVRMTAAGRDVVAGSTGRGPLPSPRLPGVQIPDGALVVPFQTFPFSNVVVTIEYERPACPAAVNQVELKLTTTIARPAPRPATQGPPLPVVAKLPESSGLPSPTVVRVQVHIGLDGRLRFPKALDGPPALASMAEALIGDVRFEPVRVNGAPTTSFIIMPATFTATGAPAPAAPAGPPIAASSSGGSAAMVTTPDVPGLTRATSRCAVSDDATYGHSASNPIKIGGDFYDGPARARQYLSALRGPAGEGLRFRRLGSLRGPDGTILDRYEITHAGITQPILLHVDQYRFDELKAPDGLACGVALTIGPPTGSPPGPTGPRGAAPPSNTNMPGATTTPGVAGLSAATSQCPIADDATYGTTTTSPIGIGGGAAGAERESKYLSVLRGPAGQGLRHQRAGAMLAPDRTTTLTVYEVSYAGLDKPVRIYFDRARAADVKAVKGFVCAAPLEVR